MAHGCQRPVKAKALEHRGAILAAARSKGYAAAEEMQELLGQVRDSYVAKHLSGLSLSVFGSRISLYACNLFAANIHPELHGRP
jgi:hypothetical protein